jgi:hypothetical protein
LFIHTGAVFYGKESRDFSVAVEKNQQFHGLFYMFLSEVTVVVIVIFVQLFF